MSNYKLLSLLIVLITGFTACGDDFLTNKSTDSGETGGDADVQVLRSYLASAYQILLFDSYADYNYNSIFLMSDLRSDDLFKGGSSAGDQGQLYRLSQLDATSTELPDGLWNIFYTGLSRCNFVLQACENPVDVDEDDLVRIMAEARFLRAYYTHWLWKFWGNIPYFTEELEAPFMAKQYKADEIYTFMMEDLDYVLSGDKLPMKAADSEAGHATKAAAMLLKARVVLYQKDQSRYADVMSDMNAIVSGGQYILMSDYEEMWLREGEFCDESIFESFQRAEGKGWGEAWQGYGTNYPAFISPSELFGQSPFIGGWGFGPVRPAAYAIYEEGDLRRDVAINHFPSDSYAARFQDTGYFMGKYAAREGYNDAPYDQDLNFENNARIFRYAEVLLNIADLAVIQGTPSAGLSAQSALDQIRSRAGLPSIPATAENVKLERRREFLGEGLRFWDLVRWGDANILTETLPDYSVDRTWADYKKYLPIPQREIDKTEGEYKLVQNDQYR